ncbi:WD40 repeat protein, COMPASS complex protein [Reticulomyxa filosa]|uniref:WD40 repeat protein, COMPASS complex protein n=1 Tax=Reticulomyxa filosa TaxID=46433 RepID=X6P4I6_RETFI|nr:WD40 repeat protein, COMPASS complex protein [Reticulomyxa filosa]|eukprot:ETO32984.1 WD40 repeat protein, COMPASS complex protein [Reticulomyxa filosa]
MGNPFSRRVISRRPSVDGFLILTLFSTVLCSICLFKYSFVVIFISQFNTDILNTFRLSYNLSEIFDEPILWTNSIDFLVFDGCPFICSGLSDAMVCVFNIRANKQVRSFNRHSILSCVKYSPYHYQNYHLHIICSSSYDVIRFCDIDSNRQLQIFNAHTIVFVALHFHRLVVADFYSLDLMTKLFVYEMLKYTNYNKFSIYMKIFNNNNSNKNNVDVIVDSGYTIYSRSNDNICIWDIEIDKKSKVRLWNIRASEQIQVFNGHEQWVMAVEYSPLEISPIGEVSGSSNVICSGSLDNTIRF